MYTIELAHPPPNSLSLSLSNLFLVEKRNQRLANLFGNNNNAHNQEEEEGLAAAARAALYTPGADGARR